MEDDFYDYEDLLDEYVSDEGVGASTVLLSLAVLCVVAALLIGADGWYRDHVREQVSAAVYAEARRDVEREMRDWKRSLNREHSQRGLYLEERFYAACADAGVEC